MRGALSSQAAILMVVRYRFKFSIELNLEPAFPNIPTATISSHYGPGRCRVRFTDFVRKLQIHESCTDF